MRLRRSDVHGRGIRRLRHGRGFRYLHADGTPVSEQDIRDRIKALVIPPAWRDVWICPWPNGHIQAVGVDDAGRRQYLYHEKWREERDQEKHDRVLKLARRLPRWRARVETDLRQPGLGCDRVIGAALRLLDRGIFRTGGEEYAEENGTHGVATLLRSHVRISGTRLTFRYPAKGGIDRAVTLADPLLVTVVKALRRNDSGSDRLLVHRNGDGWHEVRAEDINERFKELAGAEYTAKDLRTWNATVLAATAFAALDPPESKTARKRAEAAVMREVADGLGNTPAVARASYVDPRVIEGFAEGRTIASAAARARRSGKEGDDLRHALERAVIRLISD